MFNQHLAWRFILLLVVSLFAISACQKTDTEVTESVVEPATEAWDAFVTRQIEEHLVAHPQFAVVSGRHEFDGQLPDWSRAGIEAEIARMHAVKDAALAFADDQLTDEQKYQREYMVSRIDMELFWSEKARWPFRNPQNYLGWMSDSLDPSVYIALDYASPEERMTAFVKYLSNLPEAAAQIRENLEMPMPLTWLQLGIDSFGGYADYFENDVPDIWAEVGNQRLQLEFSQANELAIQAMQGLADWLKKRRPRTVLLRPDLPARRAPRDRRWAVAVNENVEADL